MKKLYVVLAVCLLWACQVTTAGAEGFALTEWSSRGLSLAGGMVGRADDPSAIAYNAAGITQLPGTHVMGGFAAIAPMGTIDLDLADGSHTSTTTKPHIWAAPHAYITHQLNDRFWLGLGLFSRFGLGNEFADNWTGRYNLTNINFQTFSLVPTVALKVNDVLSLSAGVEIMHASFAMGQQIPSMQYIGYFPSKGEDSKMTLNGTGWGVGAQLGAHFRMTDELSLGFSYKSPVTLNIAGSADFSRHHSNMLADQGQVPHTIDTDVHSTVHLPDSFAVGLAYRPLENLSFEVGTVFTRWSTYDSLNIYFDSDFQSIIRSGVTAGTSTPAWNTSPWTGWPCARASGTRRRSPTSRTRISWSPVTAARASAWARASSGATGRSIWPMPIFGCTAWTIRRPMPPVSVRPWGMSAAGTAGTRWPTSIPPPSATRSDGWTATSGMTGCRQTHAGPECRHGPVAVLTVRN